MTTHSQTGSFDLSALNNLNQNLTQYFWFEEGGSGSYPWGLGAHVTLYPQSDFTNPNDSNYLKGQNILINTDGFSLRNGTIPLMAIDNDSLDFNLITDLSQGTYVNVATFGATGATIGQLGGAHSVIDANGQRFYGGSDGTERLANIGYGETKGETGTTNSPFYTFGIRGGSTASNYNPTATYSVGAFCIYNDVLYICVEDITTPEAWDSTKWQIAVGSYSFAEGRKTVASGYYSHAEGSSTTAIGDYSHAEGMLTKATGIYSHSEGGNCESTGGYGSHAEGFATKASGQRSHAEGNRSVASGTTSHAEGDESVASGTTSHAEGSDTEASGFCAHAEGSATEAIGTCSHAQGSHTITNFEYETAIGKYNLSNLNRALTIGNGTSNNARSNALTVDWNGCVEQTAQTTIAQNKYAELKLSVHQSDNDVTSNGFIRVYDDHDAYNYGTNMVIQSNGNMVIGGGESPYNLYDAVLKDSSGEVLFLTSDGNIQFVTNCQTIGDRVTTYLDGSRQFYPATNGQGSLGTASYHWGNSYLNYIHVGTIGSLNGYAPTTWVDLSNAQLNVDNLTSSNSTSEWLKSAVKAICTKYPNMTDRLFRGFLHPGSRGYFEVFIYNTSQLSGGLPQYCFGTYRRYSTEFQKFGTENYSWTCTNVDTNTTYSSKAAASGGTDVSLCTTGEKYTWNNKVSGVKGNSETSYRTGNVNITKANLGLGNVENKSAATILSELSIKTGVMSAAETVNANSTKWLTVPKPSSGTPIAVVGFYFENGTYCMVYNMRLTANGAQFAVRNLHTNAQNVKITADYLCR